MNLEYTKDAINDLKRLDKQIARRITAKRDWFAAQGDPLSFAEPLLHWNKAYRFRIGDYRAIFTVTQNVVSIILVFAIEHRKDIYR